MEYTHGSDVVSTQKEYQKNKRIECCSENGTKHKKPAIEIDGRLDLPTLEETVRDLIMMKGVMNEINNY